MVARTVNETLNVVEHTPPVHKKVSGVNRRGGARCMQLGNSSGGRW
jgi:hypothetical protein